MLIKLIDKRDVAYLVSGIIMAAGFSKRMGKDKLLMDFRGKRLLSWVIEAGERSQLDELVLIYRRNEFKKLAHKYKIRAVFNDRAHLGQACSIHLGVTYASNENFMFLPGDQPFIDYRLIDKLLKKHRQDRRKIVVPFYEGCIGLPAIFPATFKDKLLKVDGDQGGRDIIRKNPAQVEKVELTEERQLLDIDNLKDYYRLLKI